MLFQIFSVTLKRRYCDEPCLTNKETQSWRGYTGVMEGESQGWEADCLSSDPNFTTHSCDFVPQFPHLKNGITVVSATRGNECTCKHLKQCLEHSKFSINTSLSYLPSASSCVVWKLQSCGLNSDSKASEWSHITELAKTVRKGLSSGAPLGFPPAQPGGG